MFFFYFWFKLRLHHSCERFSEHWMVLKKWFRIKGSVCISYFESYFISEPNLESESESSVHCWVFFSAYWSDLNLNHWKILDPLSTMQCILESVMWNEVIVLYFWLWFMPLALSVHSAEKSSYWWLSTALALKYSNANNWWCICVFV